MFRAVCLSVFLIAPGVPLLGALGVTPALDRLPGPEQTPPTPQPPTRPVPVPAAEPPQPRQPPAEPPTPRKVTRGRDLNLQIEITISDQAGSGTPDTKVVSMLVADQTMGRIRASADARRADVGMVGTGLNIDARPSILDNDRILLELTVEYTPFRESGEVMQRPTVLNESLSVILQNGKPMIVSQAADPVTDRKMTVELRASIIK